MTTINLRAYYPEIYNHDHFIEVSDDVAAAFVVRTRKEAAGKRRMYWHDAHYSLDREDGIENDALKKPLPVWAVYEQNFIRQQLHKAIANLPEKQRRRIYAHYFLGMSKAAIARAEGVDERVVRIAITRGEDALRKKMKKFQK